MSRMHKAGSLLLTGVIVTACQDLPLSIPSGDLAAPFAASALPSAGRALLATCYTSRRVEMQRYPYEYGILRLRFPAAVQRHDGSTRLFRWRVQDSSGEALVSGTCEIPDTPEAINYAHTRLGLGEPRRPRGRGDIAALGCVQDGFCEIDGIVVTAPGPTTWGWAGGAGWGGSGCGDGLDASVCDTYDPYGGGAEPDPGPDGTYRPECERDNNGFCVTRQASSEEWATLAQRISQLRSPTPGCARAKAILQELHAQGPGAQRIRGWDGYDAYWDDDDQRWEQRYGQNLSDAQGRYIEYDWYWVTRDQELLAHEALHWYLDEMNSPLMGDDAEVWIRGEQKRCANG